MLTAVLPVDIDIPTLRRRYLASGGALTEPIDPAANATQLRRLLQRHQRSIHASALAQLVALHPQVDAALLTWILTRWPDDAGVWNAVATRPGDLPPALLSMLHAAPWASVRAHADLAQLRQSLRGATAQEFARALEASDGDDEHALARRRVLASHPEIPRELLERLACDDDLAPLAHARLATSAPSPQRPTTPGERG